MENIGFIIRKTNGKTENKELSCLGLKDYLYQLHFNMELVLK